MFLKIVRSGLKVNYVYVVEAYRNERGKVSHRYLFSLGKLEDILSSPGFKKLAKLALKDEIGEIEEKEGNLSFDNNIVSDGEILKYGHLILKKLWDKFKLDEYFLQIKGKTKISYDLTAAIFYMVTKHIMEPDSKLGMYESKDNYLNLPSINLNHLYRSLDILAECKDDLEVYLFEKNRDLFNMEVDVVFYDVTTIYFESKDEDMLRKFGFSKDGKSNEVQVVLGLLTDQEGRPIGYDLFEGNTFDGNTLQPFLGRLKKRFNINRIVIVADKGINSKVNLGEIKFLGYEYIVATRLKSMDKKILEKVFDPADYVHIKSNNNNDDDIFKYKVIERDNVVRDRGGDTTTIRERLVVTYSSKRAKKDAFDRERLIKKAMKLLEKPSAINGLNKRGGKKYLSEVNTNHNNSWQLDSDMIERDARFDGYYCIQTSEENLEPFEIMEAYHNLWRIEESFRIMKSTLEIRPVFHYTEKRIKGHFVLCFLAFLLLRTLEIKLRDEHISITNIKEALNSFTVTKFTLRGEDLLLKNKTNAVAKTIRRSLKINDIRNITPLKEFII